MFRLNISTLIYYLSSLPETKHDRIPAITKMLLAGILLYYICFGSLCSPQHIWIPAIFFDKSKNKELKIFLVIFSCFLSFSVILIFSLSSFLFVLSCQLLQSLYLSGFVVCFCALQFVSVISRNDYGQISLQDTIANDNSYRLVID